MQLPRKYYREIARQLIENPNHITAACAVKAINDLLDDRAKLSLKLAKQNTVPKKRKWFWRRWIFG